MNKRLALLLAGLLLVGCTRTVPNGLDPTGSTDTPPAGGDAVTVAPVQIGDYFSSRDLDQSYDPAAAVTVTLTGSTATCADPRVRLDGSTVTFTDEGVFILSGSLTGMLIVDAEKTDKIQLVMDGAAVTSPTSAALYVKQADKVFLTLAEGSQNSFTQGGSFTAIDDRNIDGAIFAADDLTLGGSGSLTVSSPAGHGVVAKDELTITGGSYSVTAAAHGFSANDSICITAAAFDVTAGKDAFKAEHDEDAALGYIVIESAAIVAVADGDGLSAGSYLHIADGSFTLTSGGGHETVTQQNDSWSWGFGGRGSSTATTTDAVSAKGIKATGDLLLRGGSYTIDAADDAIHSNANLTISGGSFTLASGDDGIHADAATVISGGTINITASYEGIEGLSITVSGGDLALIASDDGLNAAGGNDGSGFGGFFGGGGGRGEGGSKPNQGEWPDMGTPPEGMPDMGTPPEGMPSMGDIPQQMPGGDSFATGETSSTFIAIIGGRLTIDAAGDGIDSNGTITVSGGETYVAGPTNSGNGALDYDRSATITGGTFIAVGAAGMAQGFSAAEQQGAIMTNLSGSAGSTITLTDESGKTLFSWVSPKAYSSIVISTPALTQGSTYTVTADTASTTVTLDSLIVGQSGGFGGPGGFGGGAPGGDFGGGRPGGRK